MPDFELVPLTDVTSKPASGKRDEMVREYVGYIDRVGSGQAGKLTPVESERATAVRRRLGIAAKEASRDVVIKRNGDDIYFWVRPRRGRPRKIS